MARTVVYDASMKLPVSKRSLLRLSPRLIIGGTVVAFLATVALLAPMIAQYGPVDVDTGRFLQPPSTAHWLGTDDLGRDIFSRVVWGARVSLSVGLISVGIGLFAGVPLGLLGGYLGGWIDLLIGRIVDTLLAFPGLILALAITAALGPALQNVMIAIGIIAVPFYARLTRGQVLAVRQRDFVLAAHVVGVPPRRILARHVFPNILNVLIVSATLWTAIAILAEAALSFLGLGVQPPSPSWGQDIAYSKHHVITGVWWPVVGPGAAIFLAVFAFNMLGDGLRDALDPRLRRRG